MSTELILIHILFIALMSTGSFWYGQYTERRKFEQWIIDEAKKHMDL